MKNLGQTITKLKSNQWESSFRPELEAGW